MSLAYMLLSCTDNWDMRKSERPCTDLILLAILPFELRGLHVVLVWCMKCKKYKITFFLNGNIFYLWRNWPVLASLVISVNAERKSGGAKSFSVNLIRSRLWLDKRTEMWALIRLYFPSGWFSWMSSFWSWRINLPFSLKWSVSE